MNKYIILTLLSSFMFLGFSCSNCKVVEEQLLTDVQKEQDPFRGFEKIIYKTGDSTIEFTGTGRKNHVGEYNFPNDNCNYGLLESDEMYFSANYFDIYLIMWESKVYSLWIWDSISNILLYSELFVDKTDGSISNYNEFLDSLNINDITYFNIYKDTLVQKNTTPVIPDSIKHAKYLYYSTEYGIVKFDFSDGSTWELKEIMW